MDMYQKRKIRQEKKSGSQEEKTTKVEINWYPGHMAKSKRLIADSMKNVDAVCEVVDARIPVSSRNPDIDALAKNKKRMIILNRIDQADPQATKAWHDYFKENGYFVIQTDSKSGAGAAEFQSTARKLLEEKLHKLEEKGMSGRAIKVMIVGIPNVGKSSFINKVLGKKTAKAENRPGVTRQNKWFTVGSGVEMLDTPGILPPKIKSEHNGLMLAFTGAIKSEILDTETLSCLFLYELSKIYPAALEDRYGIEVKPFDEAEYTSDLLVRPEVTYGYEMLSQIAAKRGFMISGGQPDTERAARMLFDEFRSGKLGRISLEIPNGSVQNV